MIQSTFGSYCAIYSLCMFYPIPTHWSIIDIVTSMNNVQLQFDTLTLLMTSNICLTIDLSSL